MTQTSEEFETRFWARVDKSGDCWLWTGGKSGDGYGSLQRERKRLMAHRVAYELLVGPIPEGLVIDHLCRNTSCVNPSHLEPVTMEENVRRGTTKSHCVRGHALVAGNLWWNPNGGYRVCLTCKRLRNREYARRVQARRVAIRGER